MAYTRREIRKFLKADELIELNGKEYIYVSADSADIVLNLLGEKEKKRVAYDAIKKIPHVDLRKSEEARQLSLLINAGGMFIAEPDRFALTPDSGPLLIETFDGDYLFGCVKQVRNKQSVLSGQLNVWLDLCANKESRTAYASLSIALPLLNTARGVNEDVDDVLVSYIENMYALQSVDLAKLPSALDAPDPAGEAKPAQPARDKPQPAVEVLQPPSAQDNVKPEADVTRQVVESFAVPYLITTQPDGYLPEMKDFTLERAGSVDDGWYSTVPIKGDRALTDGEEVSAFLVNRRNGEMSRFAYVACKDNLEGEKWPAAFAHYIASQAAAMTAGAWSEGSAFSTATTPLRLWCHAKYRAFTNAPFTANLIQVLACNDRFQLTAGQTLCLQVRDLKTQALFEQHFFQVAEEQAGAGWSRSLCEQINRDSHLLRAGVLGGDCHVAPADKGNALWGPQCAELSVTLTLANWWESRKVEGSQALDAGTTLHAWVFDAFSRRLLAQHEWTPSNVQRGSGKWLAAWASALNTSDVSAYLRAGVASPTEDNLKVTATKGLGLWHRGDALRVFTSLPDAGNRSAGLALELPEGSKTTDDLQVTVRHPFSGQVLHTAVFTPASEDECKFDPPAWRVALIEFLKHQAWPELHVQLTGPQKHGDPGVWLPRFCELQVDLDPVADVDPAATTAAGLPTLTLTSGSGSLRINVGVHAGELEFRLNRAAFNKGVRIAACVPVATGEAVSWPISVTADRITWGALAEPCAYEMSLDCPENLYGEQEQTVGHIGAFSETRFWQAPQPVPYTPPSALTPYEPTSLLCEDYGNTERSEIFDTLGQGESGVDPRTGLFHAHYPVATLQGLSGLGPICDLTLHYSALRGNEAGLGDGWAWRFSSLDVRERCLTLANGMRITFTREEWQALGEEKPLKKKHCVVQSDKEYSQFTLDLPSGRREVLRKPGPAGSDEEEPNAKFVDNIINMLKAIKKKSKPKFPAVPEHWTQWALLVLSPAAYYIGAKLDYDEACTAWEKHGSVKELDERIAYYERPFVQLMPARIVSLYGQALDLEWKRQKGQFLLMGIKSGEQALFTAQYLTPSQSDAQVNMQLWPTSDERFEVNLQLQNCLLRTLTRTQEQTDEKTKERTRQIIQQVNCDYADDPTLDRVLCRLTELDGSVECVQYRPGIRGKGKPLWPQALLHALIPGDGHENQVNTYRYTGRLLDTSDQLYIIEGERGAHGAREHYLHVFGLDDQIQRQELLVGSASADSQWLEFKARQSGKAQVIRYTGYGDDLVKAIEQLKLDIRKGKAVLLLGQQRVKYQPAIVELVWSYGRRGRTRLISSIESLLQVCPAWQRPVLGKAVDRLITEQNDDGLPIKLITQGQHTLHSTYYPAGGGENIVSAATLNGLSGVSGVPQLSCPTLPDHAVRPLMAEYQCDDFGNSLGLKLFGYRSVQRDGRTFLELEQQVVIEGIGVGGSFDGQFSSSTPWVKTADEVLWRQRITTVSPVAGRRSPPR